MCLLQIPPRSCLAEGLVPSGSSLRAARRTKHSSGLSAPIRYEMLASRLKIDTDFRTLRGDARYRASRTQDEPPGIASVVGGADADVLLPTAANDCKRGSGTAFRPATRY